MGLDELLKNMKLSEAEREVVVLDRAEKENLPAVKWMAVGKLLTMKQYSEQSLAATMRAAWTPAREVSFCKLRKNLFTVQAHCLGDWKRIMEEGLWIFRGYTLMLEEYDGSTSLPTVPPSKVQAWIQIHKVPPLYRIESIMK